MGTAISLFDTPSNNLPAHLTTFNSGLSTDLAIGGAGRNRLSLKGNRFRLIVAGQEEAVLESTSLEIIIVGASPGVGRIYYEGSYAEGEKTHPVCYSSNGVEPGPDVTHPQSLKCANCPQNQKGSKITVDNVKTKACTYFKRLAVALTTEVDPEHRIFQLDGKAMTIFGEGQPEQNKFTLTEYANNLKTRGWDPAHLITKLTFDVDSSVPKLYFSPVRMLNEEEAPWVQDLINSEEVKNVVTINAITDTSDANSEEAAPAADAPVETVAPKATAKPTPAAQAKPTVVKATAVPPKVVGAPKAAPAATVVKVAPKPAAPVVAETAGDSELDDFLKQLDDTSGEE